MNLMIFLLQMQVQLLAQLKDVEGGSAKFRIRKWNNLQYIK